MEQPKRVCVIVDDEIEIYLNEEQLKYMDTPRSTEATEPVKDSHQLVAGFSDSTETCHSNFNKSLSVSDGYTDRKDINTLQISPGNSISTAEVSLNHERNKSSPRASTSGFANSCKTSQKVDGADNVSHNDADKENQNNMHGCADNSTSPRSKHASPDKPVTTVAHSDCEGSCAQDSDEAADAAAACTEVTNADGRLTCLDYLSMKLSRAGLDSQRKKLCQKSFQGCNYLDVGKLRSPKKHVPSVLRTYINSSGNPAGQRPARDSAELVGAQLADNGLSQATPPRSTTPGQSPCSVIHQSARTFGRPLATPELLASPAPLITIHRRLTPLRTPSTDQPQLRINESIYETYEAKLVPRS